MLSFLFNSSWVQTLVQVNRVLVSWMAVHRVLSSEGADGWIPGLLMCSEWGSSLCQVWNQRTLVPWPAALCRGRPRQLWDFRECRGKKTSKARLPGLSYATADAWRHSFHIHKAWGPEPCRGASFRDIEPTFCRFALQTCLVFPPVVGVGLRVLLTPGALGITGRHWLGVDRGRQIGKGKGTHARSLRITQMHCDFQDPREQKEFIIFKLFNAENVKHTQNQTGVKGNPVDLSLLHGFQHQSAARPHWHWMLCLLCTGLAHLPHMLKGWCAGHLCCADATQVLEGSWSLLFLRLLFLPQRASFKLIFLQHGLFSNASGISHY